MIGSFKSESARENGGNPPISYFISFPFRQAEVHFIDKPEIAFAATENRGNPPISYFISFLFRRAEVLFIDKPEIAFAATENLGNPPISYKSLFPLPRTNRGCAAKKERGSAHHAATGPWSQMIWQICQGRTFPRYAAASPGADYSPPPARGAGSPRYPEWRPPARRRFMRRPLAAMPLAGGLMPKPAYIDSFGPAIGRFQEPGRR